MNRECFYCVTYIQDRRNIIILFEYSEKKIKEPTNQVTEIQDFSEYHVIIFTLNTRLRTEFLRAISENFKEIFPSKIKNINT